jgi:peptidyl-prolyl cis-trans isomerase SDCCAG10
MQRPVAAEPAGRPAHVPGFAYRGEPILVTEFGGLAFDSDDEGWMSHKLSFAADRLGKDLTNRKKAEEELIVIDPREKARALKEGKRGEREKDKGSGKAWDQRRDQAKNAKLAQAASLAGRGAK